MWEQTSLLDWRGDTCQGVDRSCSSHIFCTGEIPIYVLINELKCSFTQNVLEKQQKYKTILLHYDWYLLTIANPDGYQETWNGLRYINVKLEFCARYCICNFREWRKNKHFSNRMNKRLCGMEKDGRGYGVDLNRCLLKNKVHKNNNGLLGILVTFGMIQDGI